jgi:uncharacterized damage-inducible protein DinB
MQSDDLRSLLDYHYWARDRVLDSARHLSAEEFIQDRGNSFASIRDTLAHTYFAEWAWYSRWHGESPAALPNPDRFVTVDALREAWDMLERQMRDFLEPLSDDDLRRVIEYRLLSGKAGASPIWQMVQHVVNHASYHRGQVTTMLRQAGHPPPKGMDLIAFYRERA